ncbi:hypothetical protein CK203_085265 [Vitis vinifera]|uniref:Reverse transcriptase domain-containing protein n=1 Tax=Vitis vinifera TaxID=29760 RepID=A0A438DSP3_VITVI|nr:hypothetical protein CK203_085265 [Vitis vinifera]
MDIGKAYDHVNWDFLLAVMTKAWAKSKEATLEKKPHMVNWNLVRVDKEGGLGICSLVALKQVLLGEGVGDLLKRGSPFGNKSLLGSLEKRMGGGV